MLRTTTAVAGKFGGAGDTPAAGNKTAVSHRQVAVAWAVRAVGAYRMAGANPIAATKGIRLAEQPCVGFNSVGCAYAELAHVRTISLITSSASDELIAIPAHEQLCPHST